MAGRAAVTNNRDALPQPPAFSCSLQGTPLCSVVGSSTAPAVVAKAVAVAAHNGGRWRRSLPARAPTGADGEAGASAPGVDGLVTGRNVVGEGFVTKIDPNQVGIDEPVEGDAGADLGAKTLSELDILTLGASGHGLPGTIEAAIEFAVVQIDRKTDDGGSGTDVALAEVQERAVTGIVAAEGDDRRRLSLPGDLAAVQEDFEIPLALARAALGENLIKGVVGKFVLRLGVDRL